MLCWFNILWRAFLTPLQMSLVTIAFSRTTPEFAGTCKTGKINSVETTQLARTETSHDFLVHGDLLRVSLYGRQGRDSVFGSTVDFYSRSVQQATWPLACRKLENSIGLLMFILSRTANLWRRLFLSEWQRSRYSTCYCEIEYVCYFSVSNIVLANQLMFIQGVL